MRWEFTEMSRSAAESIAAWHYDELFGFYDMTFDADDLALFTDENSWRLTDLGSRERFLAVHADGELAGFFSVQGSPDLCTIGLGLAPHLTGRSLGQGFVAAGLEFARERWAVSKFRLEVASFNARAIKVYERAGFTRQRVLIRESAGTLVEFIEMTR